MAARPWTPEQRAQQALLIRNWQPWHKSTGAKTLEGKSIASRNAYKGGNRALMRGLYAILREQKRELQGLFD